LILPLTALQNVGIFGKTRIPGESGNDRLMAQGVAARRDADVLIAGAGPTGLVLGLWLTRLGVRVRIVDRAEQMAATSRAVAVQARTLELYDQIGLADTVTARGRRAVGATLWVAGRKVARVVFGDMGIGISPYPYALIFPQDEHERVLIDRLRDAGVEVERRVELTGVEETDGHVVARLTGRSGAVETCRAAYLAGCDGAHSVVRDALAIGFPGGTYAHVFYVADVDASGPAMNGDVHVAFDTTDFLAVFPLKGDGRARLVGTLRSGAETQHESLSWDDVSTRVIDWMRIDVAHVNWFSTCGRSTGRRTSMAPPPRRFAWRVNGEGCRCTSAPGIRQSRGAGWRATRSISSAPTATSASPLVESPRP
jgi:2-polyprenyl-6-methoxyphenol hydroxylase-like FAD-dependent oxidoreductase